MDCQIRTTLDAVARRFGTPSYVYFISGILSQIDQLHEVFENRFGLSYAVKANPNLALLDYIRHKVVTLDVSSIGEVERAFKASYPADRLTFSGPAKRVFELEKSVEVGVGELVCESLSEIEMLDELAGAAGKRVSYLIRINPKTMPRKFGLNMSGRPSQFGIDEEQLDEVLAQRDRWGSLDFTGFHIYSGTNSLDEEAIANNFSMFIELFDRFSNKHGLAPRKLIFGSGFGIPHLPEENPLDLQCMAELINPRLDEMRKHRHLADAECVLEMGRFLVGPSGYFLTSVVREKQSRGTEIRMCDGGFNNHLVACGLMGTVIRRNWRFTKVNDPGAGPTRTYLLSGPLCTTLDALAINVELPPLSVGDVVAVGMSGAYGLSCSPSHFISHPQPREIIVIGSGPDAEMIDATETPTAIHVPFSAQYA